MQKTKKFMVLASLFLALFMLGACTPQEQKAVEQTLTNSDDAMMGDSDDATNAMTDDNGGDSMADDSSDDTSGDSMDDSTGRTDDDSNDSDDSADDSDDQEVKTFTMTGKNFEFSMKEMKVKQGDRVKVVFTSESGFHDWVVDEFDAATERVLSGKTTSVEFTANKKGTFEYYCSVGEHRQLGMVGTLIVE